MFSIYMLVCVILTTRGITAVSGEYTTTSIQQQCVPSQECPPEVLAGLEEAEAGYREAVLTRNASLLFSLAADGFTVRGCDFPALECNEDFYDVFVSGEPTIPLGTGYCELINSDIAYWEFYTIEGFSGKVYSDSIIYKKVDGKWLFFKAFVVPHQF